MFVSVSFIIFLAMTGFGSFKAYEYTESDEFCGTMCHEVMQPEYTAYSVSPHARVGQVIVRSHRTRKSPQVTLRRTTYLLPRYWTTSQAS